MRMWYLFCIYEFLYYISFYIIILTDPSHYLFATTTTAAVDAIQELDPSLHFGGPAIGALGAEAK